MDSLDDDSILDKNILEERILLIEAMNFEGKSFEEIKSVFLSTLGGIPLAGLTFSLNTPIYRARILDFSKEDVSKPSTFSYPPANYSKRGRANLDGYSVFYGSAGVAATFHELKCQPKDSVYIGKWTLAKNTTAVAAIFLFDNTKGVSRLWNPVVL